MIHVQTSIQVYFEELKKLSLRIPEIAKIVVDSCGLFEVDQQFEEKFGPTIDGLLANVNSSVYACGESDPRALPNETEPLKVD